MPYHTLVVSLLAVVAVVLIVSGLVEAGTAAKVKEPIGLNSPKLLRSSFLSVSLTICDQMCYFISVLR